MKGGNFCTKMLCLMLFSINVLAFVAHGQGTRVGFYSKVCPQAESIVKSTVQTHLNSNPSLAPGILRLHFHDCFVRGCDASILIAGAGTERTGRSNLNLRGYEVIDDTKAKLEAACPGVVSCADILTLAARDAVVLSGGMSWEVPTGRRDGVVSLASETNNLPGGADSAQIQKTKFQEKGLNTQDLVTLAGGHSIGATSCRVIRNRLYNFTADNGPDPSINPSFLSQLRSLCPENSDGSTGVSLDFGSRNRFDNNYFHNLREGKGVLHSDQVLWSDASTKTYVQRYSGSRFRFDVEFGKAMVKMGNIGVKTGGDGEIRTKCSAVN